MQYRVGNVSVENGSSTVTGDIGAWLTNVTAGDLFSITGTGVVYQVASVESNTSLTLTAPFAGSTASGLLYIISRDFTPNAKLPLIKRGDIETTTVLGEALKRLDQMAWPITTVSSPEDKQAIVYDADAGLFTNQFIVNSLTGTASQILVSGATGNITLSLPTDVVVGSISGSGAGLTGVVHTTGTETVGGAKTLTAALTLTQSYAATSAALNIESTSPAFYLVDTDNAGDAKRWCFSVDGTTLTFHAQNDAATISSAWLRVDRSGSSIAAITYGNADDNPHHVFDGWISFSNGGGAGGHLGYGGTSHYLDAEANYFRSTDAGYRYQLQLTSGNNVYGNPTDLPAHTFYGQLRASSAIAIPPAGVTTATTTWWKIATLPASNAGTYDKLGIVLIGGQWVSAYTFRQSLTFANRNGFSYQWNATGGGLGYAGVLCYAQDDGTTIIYVVSGNGFASWAIESLSNINATIHYDMPTTTSEPAGTKVFSSAEPGTYPPQFLAWSDANRKELIIGGTSAPQGTPYRSVLAVSGSSTAIVEVDVGGVTKGFMYTDGTNVSFGSNNDASTFLCANGGNKLTASDAQVKITVNEPHATPGASLLVRNDGSGSGWYGRMMTSNATLDKSVFLGSYDNGVSTGNGLFAHNNALDAWSTLYINRIGNGNGATTYMGSADILGATFGYGAGVNFGNQTGSSGTDLSKHIDLYGGTYGFNVTSSSLNYNTSTGAAHKFYTDGVSALETSSSLTKVMSNQLYMITGSIVRDTSDGWMRLNPDGSYWNGVFTSGLIRADGGIQVPTNAWNIGDWNGRGRIYFQTASGSGSTYVRTEGGTGSVILRSGDDVDGLTVGNGLVNATVHTMIGPIAGSTSTGNQTGLEIKNTGGTGEGDVAAISFHCAGSYGIHMHLRHDGYFGIGGWSSPSWRWYSAPNGDMYASGNITAAGGQFLGNATTATNSTYSQHLWSTSHPGTYYIDNAWDGTHWNITSNHGAPTRVGYADAAPNVGGKAGTTKTLSASAPSGGSDGDIWYQY